MDEKFLLGDDDAEFCDIRVVNDITVPCEGLLWCPFEAITILGSDFAATIALGSGLGCIVDWKTC